ncbi:MAG: PTS transporter subunit EIIC [Escherichia sp.]
MLPALISGGLISVLQCDRRFARSNGQTLAQMYPSLQTIYDFLWLIGETIFFYLPVGICWSAVKKWAVHRSSVSCFWRNAGFSTADERLSARAAAAESMGLWHVQHRQSGLSAQVIPALLAGLALGVIETRLKRIVPDYLYLVVVPVCSLILAVFLAHALIGPFGVRMIGDGVALCGTSPDDWQLCSIGAALFGFLYALLVITGVPRPRLLLICR